MAPRLLPPTNKALREGVVAEQLDKTSASLNASRGDKRERGRKKKRGEGLIAAFLLVTYVIGKFHTLIEP